MKEGGRVSPWGIATCRMIQYVRGIAIMQQFVCLSASPTSGPVVSKFGIRAPS